MVLVLIQPRRSEDRPLDFTYDKTKNHVGVCSQIGASSARREEPGALPQNVPPPPRFKIRLVVLTRIELRRSSSLLPEQNPRHMMTESREIPPELFCATSSPDRASVGVDRPSDRGVVPQQVLPVLRSRAPAPTSPAPQAELGAFFLSFHLRACGRLTSVLSSVRLLSSL